MPYLRATIFFLAAAFFVLLDRPDGSAQSSAGNPRSTAQLEQLVAPIALHPDALISQILMAATYPTEVVQAARWARANVGMASSALQEALDKQAWDPSVKALTAVPQVLEMMNDQLDWTVQLGDAFLAQQEDVLAAVQRLRQRADAAGKLQSTPQQKVTKTAGPGSNARTQIITIDSTDRDLLYVPVYDPSVIYGEWPYPDYPPIYWHPAGFYESGVLSFAAAVAIGSAIWGHVNWWNNRVDIDINRYNQFNRAKISDKNWRHDPRHRGNVPYRDAGVAKRFADPARAGARDAFREKASAGRGDLAEAAKAGKAKGVAKRTQASRQKGKHASKDRQSVSKKQRRSKAQSAGTARSKTTGAPRRNQFKQGSRPRTVSPRAQARRGGAHGYRPAGGGRRAGMGGGRRMGGGGRRGRR